MGRFQSSDHGKALENLIDMSVPTPTEVSAENSCREKLDKAAQAGNQIGVVVIGRNEAERLEICLRSVLAPGTTVVYVDSGSTDGSTDRARKLGAEVIALDLSQPFTAARARNAGFLRLRELIPDLLLVQFIDGDCEIRDGWLQHAVAALQLRQDVAVVCGRLRERHTERSVYIRMCDIGWDYPVGEIAACGGVAMYRANAYAEAGGFNEALIAGEEFDLCVRIRRAGGRVVRIAEEMAWHDVGITRFRQWWKRAIRSGYAYAEGSVLHSQESGNDYTRGTIRALFWGILVPFMMVFGLLGTVVWEPLAFASLTALLLLLAQIARLASRQFRLGRSPQDAIALGAFLVLSKLPESLGAMRYWYKRAFRRQPTIIEYR